ncbi:MAG: class I SAM-dependent methyltransferase [Rhizobiaceae bacterium]|nr:class I SAM-dependent methyltransferase [Rhizobiaceae bacterium]MCV0404813.1 class I SAM-dependent methyltransferase [Rhizobiaceae bacterium]
MSFSIDWLMLREGADRAARDPDLLERAQAWLAGGDDPLAVDLGAGTGSTARAVGANAARWLLVDRDPVLLEEARHRLDDRAETIEADLAEVEDLPLDGARLVTASALFDLAGAEWIERIADAVAKRGAGLYAALTYDGRMEWQPRDADDQPVTEAFNRDQKRDKGLGEALGPDAGEALADAMRRRGYQVEIADSLWRLEGGQAALQRELLTGIAEAATRGGFDAAGWLERRLVLTRSGHCSVGHVDILAVPRDG